METLWATILAHFTDEGLDLWRGFSKPENVTYPFICGELEPTDREYPIQRVNLILEVHEYGDDDAMTSAWETIDDIDAALTEWRIQDEAGHTGTSSAWTRELATRITDEDQRSIRLRVVYQAAYVAVRT